MNRVSVGRFRNKNYRISRWWGCLLGVFFSATVAGSVENDSVKLQKAWATLLNDLQKAEETLIKKEHYPPEKTSRVLADGYRYLLAHINREIESGIRADPRFPEFFRSMDMLRKWTGENPDTMYLKAPIDAAGLYEVTIKAENTQEWQSGNFVEAGKKAPRLVTFQTITSVPGYTGELEEMKSCKNQTLDFINGLSLKESRPGYYKILIGPEKPEEYDGNFLYSRREMRCAGTGENKTFSAHYLSVREIFSDWDREVPLDLSIVRLDSMGANRPPLNVDDMANIISNLGKNVANQVRFWNLLMEFPMEMRQDRNGDGQRAVPVNGIKQPAPPFTAGGVAGAKQLYASGIFELDDDQALVVKMTSPVEPYYVGFQLNNLWMEGPDQQNYVSSLTGAQNPPVDGNTRYYIIASRDPGVQGWVDTTGLQKGFHTFRFVFNIDLPKELLPKLETQLVPLNRLSEVLPPSIPKVSTEQRMHEIAVRQSHIKMRWRNY